MKRVIIPLGICFAVFSLLTLQFYFTPLPNGEPDFSKVQFDQFRAQLTTVSALPDEKNGKQGGEKGKAKKMEKATFGNGCFWCTEAVFQRLKGVESVTSGYTGGEVVDPTYKQVCSGKTGHAEAIEIEFDPEVISFDELLEVFWKTHDPTTLNRQGADVGTQYRSAIFFHNENQQKAAEYYKKKLNDEKVFKDPIVTEITPAAKFYSAEKYHQDYFNQNQNAGYCRAVIIPKLKKFKETFQDKLKE